MNRDYYLLHCYFVVVVASYRYYDYGSGPFSLHPRSALYLVDLLSSPVSQNIHRHPPPPQHHQRLLELAGEYFGNVHCLFGLDFLRPENFASTASTFARPRVLCWRHNSAQSASAIQKIRSSSHPSAIHVCHVLPLCQFPSYCFVCFVSLAACPVSRHIFVSDWFMTFTPKAATTIKITIFHNHDCSRVPIPPTRFSLRECSLSVWPRFSSA